MAGPVNPGSEPVSFANPILSPPSMISNNSISPLKQTDPSRLDPSLRSIASAGLRGGSLSPVTAKSRLSPHTMATTGNSDRRSDNTERDRASSHHSDLQTAREALGAVMGVTNDRTKDGVSENSASATTHNSVPTLNHPSAPTTVAAETATAGTTAADVSRKHSTTDSRTDGKEKQQRQESRASPGGSDGLGPGENSGTAATLMNSTTVASPGPIEEPNPMESTNAPRRRDDDATMLDEGSKAFSYPVPMPASNANDPRRGMSLPHSGFNKGSPRSPSAKKHRCPFCSTEFTRHHNLKSHLLTHSQEKPYVCQTCQSRFRRLHDLKRHTKLHTGERPHICNKCGRRFARGDALARHNKGQSGCAGRRSSMGGYLADDDYGDGGAGGHGGTEDSMEGLMYTEPDRMDEEEERRASEMPRIKRHNAPDLLQHKTTFPSHQSNTYPPLAVNKPTQGGLFPPVNSHQGSSSSTSPISQSGNISFPAPGGSGSSYNTAGQRGSSPSLFAQTNMTESPKPLSPNTMSTQQLGHGPEANVSHQHSRSRSPGAKQPYHPVSGTSGGSHSSLPTQGTLGLGPPQSGAPQLPPPPGLNLPDARLPLHVQGAQPSGQLHQSSSSILNTRHSHSPILPHHTHSDVNTGIGNSHGNHHDSNHTLHSRQLSVSSTAGAPPDVWRHVQALEHRLTGLEEEVVRLRGQLATSGGHSHPVTNGT